MSRLWRHVGVGALVCLMGCSGSDRPELGYVSGVVTVSGQPLANAIVTFTPENGRPSKGTTDESGRFELMYTQDALGAMIGQHTVGVALIQTDEEGDRAEGEDASQKLPAAAADRSITKEVKAGSNEIEIAL